jgi:very-short-patch-repair endonuclease
MALIDDKKQEYYFPLTGTAKKMRHHQTDAEAMLWNLLRNRQCGGFVIRRQVPVGMYILDFYCATVRLAIEVDGSIHDNIAVHEYDKTRQKILEEEFKINVFRLTNQEVLEAREDTLRKILDALTQAEATCPDWINRPARRPK